MNSNKRNKNKQERILIEERTLLQEQKWIKQYQEEIRKILLALQVEGFRLESLLNLQPNTELIQKEATTTNDYNDMDVPSIVNTRELDLRILNDVNAIINGNFPPEEEEECDSDEYLNV